MDRSLDESIAARQRASNSRTRRPPRRDNYPRDGVRKSTRDDKADLDREWLHDRYADDPDSRPRGPRRNRDDHDSRYPPEPDTNVKVRVDNLHYELAEDDIRDLFERIGHVASVSFRYDRAGRSEGTAFVTVPSMSLARAAVREYDGANAKGQPIKLTIMPSGPGRRADNPFDRVEPPRRSLFDRVERPRDRSASPTSADRDDSYDDRDRRGPRRRGGGRVDPPGDRRSDVSKPAPENIDRYVPGQDRDYSPAPRRRGGGGAGLPRENGRRPGQRRENSRRDRDREEGGGGQKTVNGRPRKTAEELDQEMEDYWGGAGTNTNVNGVAAGVIASQNGNVAVGGPGAGPEVARVAAADEGLGEVDMDVIE
ncbi:MAG: hypothetical protein Q9160_008149 [Pyrenula sp. 1 TL-2023]